MRARTMQSTCGNFSSDLGGFCDEVSTGTDLGSFSKAGVADPGVDGGVKAGLTRVPGSGELDLLPSRSYWARALPGRG